MTTALAVTALALVGRPQWFRLARHDVRSTLPAAIRGSMQPGFLEQMFRQALRPEFLFPALADAEPWQGRLGDTKTFTRSGLLTPSTTAITGSDTTTGTYNLEQWSVTMDQYGKAVQTNLLGSSMQISSQFVQDIKVLGTHAGQSINRVARDKLFKAYAGGRTWVATDSSSSTALIVQSTDGFEFVSVSGALTAVSGTNPLTVTVNGVANTVTAVNTGTKTLTLGSAISGTTGQAVVSANAPTVINATGATAFNLTSSNNATFALFRSAVARLRKMAVPPAAGGNYVAHIDADTETQLFADADFKQLYQGRGTDSPYGPLSIGQFGGIDWVRNIEAPVIKGGTHTSGNIAAAALDVHRAIVMGAGALTAAPFDGIGSLLSGTGVEAIPSINMINVAPKVDVALIVPPPSGNLQQTITSSWSWIGDYGVPTDLYASSGDAALYKRAVVVQHA